MRWLRHLIRKTMRPIPKAYAFKMKSRLSFVYYFSAWNLMILVILYTAKYTFPETEEDQKYRGKYYARVMGTGDARVIKFSGLTKVDDYEIKGKQRISGRTLQEREAQQLEWDEFNDKMQAKRKREYLGLPEPNDSDDELLDERHICESEAENREDLNLLVEETSSL